jgi:signal peptidase II
VQSATPEGEPAAPPAPPAPPAPVDPDPPPRRRLVMLVATAVVVLVLDVATKVLVVATMTEGQRIPLLGDTVSLYLIRNSGAAFSLATGLTWVLTLVAIAVVVGIVRFARRLRSPGWAIALGLVLGGALGNLGDRFFRAPGPLEGHVVDFVSVGWWPVFNAADSAICCGGALLVVLALAGVEIDGRRAARVVDAPQSGGAR